MLNVGVIGLGIGEQHARAFQTLPETAVAMLCDFSREKLTKLGSIFPEAVLTQNAAEMIANPDLSIISIASYDDYHFEQALASLKAGKHTFVEKPLCRSLEEVAALKACWAANPSLVVRSNLVLRSAPLYQWLREALRDGELGDIYAFDGDYLYGRLEKITEGWRKDVNHYSVMQGGGVHLADLMMWTTGHRPTLVTAVGNRIVSQGTAFNYNDFMAATFQFPSGMIGRITANFGCVHRHQHVVRVFGTKGTFIYDDAGPRLHTSREPTDSPTRLDLSALPATKGDLIPAFVEAVRMGTSPQMETQHEFDIISACAAADMAATTNSPTGIDYI